jgi:hypothetical protein
MAKSSSTIQIYQKVDDTNNVVKAEISPTPSANNSKHTTKNSSETPTPTISQQSDAFNSDVVRIYVPPSDEMMQSSKTINVQRDRNDDEMSQCSNRSSIVHVEYETLPYEKSNYSANSINHNQDSSAAHHNYEQISPISNNSNKYKPQYYYPNQSSTATKHQQQQSTFQSSSSRRGSMTRKTPSPMIEADIMIECDHMKMRRSQENLYNDNEDTSINYSVNGSTTSSNKYYQFKIKGNNHNNNNNNKNNSNNNNNSNNTSGSVKSNSVNLNNGSSPIKRLTSFEELAKKSESNSLLYIHESISDNNYRQYGSKPKSDYNICYNYKNLDSDDLDYPSIKHQLMIKKSTSHNYNLRKSTDRKHSSSDNNSPFDYDLLRDKRKDNNRFMYEDDDDGIQVENNVNENSIKSYDRFFNSDDEIDDEYERRHHQNRMNKKSSSNSAHKYRSTHISGTEADDDENSSNSPPNKSISNTPMTECIPLLSCDAEQTIIYQSPIPPVPISPPSLSLSNSMRQQQKTSRIPLRVSSNNSNSPIRKNSSLSSPDSDERPNISQNVAYQSPTKNNASNFNNRTTTSSGTGRSQQSDNKIRIKIKQNN